MNEMRMNGENSQMDNTPNM